jgi:hypothetical protein
MATKASFAPEEWTLLLQSPMVAGVIVSAADPNGLFGMLKESFAAGGALAQARADVGASPLVQAVAAGFATAEGRAAARDGVKARLAGGTPGEVKARSLEALRRVAALLAAKAPEDAAAFKAWLTGVARRVAEAAQGGGSLGFGGVPVSGVEKATLAEIDAALA